MPNTFVQLLEEIADTYDLLGDVYRSRAYAAAAVKYRATSNPAALTPKMRALYDEYTKSGTLAILAELRAARAGVEELSKILGVGAATIEKWKQQKVTNITTLKQAVAKGKIKLTNTQRLGLQYYDDLNRRIPRADATEIVNVVTRAIKEALTLSDGRVMDDPVVTAAGSYRRGAASSGDVDILVGLNVSITAHDVVMCMIPPRQNNAFTDRVVGVVGSGDYHTTLLFKSQTGQVCQIDIIVTPMKSYAAAIMYFTGSYDFNIKMRNLASRQGYLLNQYGLFKVTPRGNVLCDTPTEADIFRELNMPNIAPKDRTAEAIPDRV